MAADLQNDSKQTQADLRVGEKQGSNSIVKLWVESCPQTGLVQDFHVSGTTKRILNHRARERGMVCTPKILSLMSPSLGEKLPPEGGGSPFRGT